MNPTTAQQSTAAETLAFPAGFVWGAATAAYQIEGAAAEDGRTPSIWDTFSHTPGRVYNDDNGDIAADHYHRYAEDVDAMKLMGLGAYRFSVSWPRVQPGGRGRANRRGIDFYARLVDSLLENGIDPVLTLYHWDLPQELEDAGGWTNRDTAYRFAEYAELVAAELGDRVPTWITLNEPWCSAFLGYASGEHAPGRIEPASALRAVHHLLLAHGLSAQALRAGLPSERQVGLTLNFADVRTVGDSEEDLRAAQRIDGLSNRLFLDPVLRGKYPQDVVAATARISDWSFLLDADLELISAPIDLLGVNYYAPAYVGASEEPVSPAAVAAYPGAGDLRFLRPDLPHTASGWPVDAAGLYSLLTRLHREYEAPPMFITENGAAYDDYVAPDGAVRDQARVAYLHDHLVAAHQAIAEGVDLRGYFVWSLLDNFEWAYGYSKRFGMIHVDYGTQRRTWKSSAHWYRAVIGSGGPRVGKEE